MRKTQAEAIADSLKPMFRWAKRKTHSGPDDHDFEMSAPVPVPEGEGVTVTLPDIKCARTAERYLSRRRNRVAAEEILLRELRAAIDAQEAAPVPVGEPERDCISCGEGSAKDECPTSGADCGHHCNHLWTHDACHWCGTGIDEDGSEVPPRGVDVAPGPEPASMGDDSGPEGEAHDPVVIRNGGGGITVRWPHQITVHIGDQDFTFCPPHDGRQALVDALSSPVPVEEPEPRGILHTAGQVDVTDASRVSLEDVANAIRTVSSKKRPSPKPDGGILPSCACSQVLWSKIRGAQSAGYTVRSIHLSPYVAPGRVVDATRRSLLPIGRELLVNPASLPEPPDGFKPFGLLGYIFGIPVYGEASPSRRKNGVGF